MTGTGEKDFDLFSHNKGGIGLHANIGAERLNGEIFGPAPRRCQEHRRGQYSKPENRVAEGHVPSQEKLTWTGFLAAPSSISKKFSRWNENCEATMLEGKASVRVL